MRIRIAASGLIGILTNAMPSLLDYNAVWAEIRGKSCYVSRPLGSRARRLRLVASGKYVSIEVRWKSIGEISRMPDMTWS
ncbi:uncharacterized protein PGTG_21953 [Puccinia graminis f. sp. tritici CRL 75-36-700-3]|uniref:Uncharacterized protein n=1 Tax=Puccinia graminis f. sp. tritici (strain CRL 75-36-700-3 / race SCCL) TaxID=418459 RepID=H6QSY2_PUCGT|nr:uncharacterized protein PGTG_21953 [Puccinia graminis f. sp. tritici CRL 75-36-700-3]EHS63936.1 hypothetical protein PGTG_21953 [Puccinia graminis f. sp. tritici CRL 75-36-700-3]